MPGDNAELFEREFPLAEPVQQNLRLRHTSGLTRQAHPAAPANPRETSSVVERRAAEILGAAGSAAVPYDGCRFAAYERALLTALCYCAHCRHGLHQPLHVSAPPDGDTRLCLNPDCVAYEKRLLIPPPATHYLVCDGPASAWPRGASS